LDDNRRWQLHNVPVSLLFPHACNLSQCECAATRRAEWPEMRRRQFTWHATLSPDNGSKNRGGKGPRSKEHETLDMWYSNFGSSLKISSSVQPNGRKYFHEGETKSKHSLVTFPPLITHTQCCLSFNWYINKWILTVSLTRYLSHCKFNCY